MLKGKKVYLRLLERRDLWRLYQISNEEEVKKYNTIPKDIKARDEYEKIRKALSIINEKNVLVGFVTYKESIYSKGTFAIGITIGSRYWNRGYGKDAINVLVQYLFDEVKAVRIELEVIKSNERAIRCYRKCGFIEEGVKRRNCYISGEYVDTIMMGIIKQDISDELV